MKILFLHQNFPGQFKHLALDLAQRGHEVNFICHTHYDRKLSGVNRIKLKGNLSFEALKNKAENLLHENELTSQQFRTAFEKMRQDGWCPDIVISHSGWGCGKHVKEIWPTTKLISYLEWWFDPNSETFTYDKYNKYLPIKHFTQKHWLRNQSIAFELSVSEVIVTPTKWQKEQLPGILRDQCEVIHDGVDQNIFRQKSILKSKVPVVTYGTRGMEPIRCFKQFVEAATTIVESNRHVRVEIAGLDEVNYGGIVPEEGSWKKWAIEYFKIRGISENIQWVGRLTFSKYVEWLQKSWCHVYLSHPFVPSWSLYEALATGCPMVVSDIKAHDFLANIKSVTLVDHRNPKRVSEGIAMQLKGDSVTLNASERRVLLPSFEVGQCLERWRAVAGLEMSTAA